MLRKGLTAAASVIGAGAILEMSAGTAHGLSRAPNDNPGNFSSSVSGVPAVTAVGTNGAHGIDVGNDNTYGIYTTSTDGIALSARSNSNYGIFGESQNSYGIYSIGHGGFAAIHGQGFNNNGVEGDSRGSGNGLNGTSISGQALVANGLVQVIGNAVGQATLAAGQKSVTVNTPAATTNSNILLTPLSTLKLPVWVTLASGSFTINISKAQVNNVTFAYLIIN